MGPRTSGSLLSRIRWGNVARLLAFPALAAVIVLWPRLAQRAPVLPDAAPQPIVSAAPAPPAPAHAAAPAIPRVRGSRPTARVARPHRPRRTPTPPARHAVAAQSPQPPAPLPSATPPPSPSTEFGLEGP